MIDEIEVRFKTTREELTSLLQKDDVCPGDMAQGERSGESLGDCKDIGTCSECIGDFIDRITVKEPTPCKECDGKKFVKGRVDHPDVVGWVPNECPTCNGTGVERTGDDE
jgi:DNA-directed RNA polymerase subunit RPC12/RpoP